MVTPSYGHSKLTAKNTQFPMSVEDLSHQLMRQIGVEPRDTKFQVEFDFLLFRRLNQNGLGIRRVKQKIHSASESESGLSDIPPELSGSSSLTSGAELEASGFPRGEGGLRTRRRRLSSLLVMFFIELTRSGCDFHLRKPPEGQG